MTHAQFLRIKRLTEKAIIQVAARHNHREILAEMGAAKGSHIDLSRTGDNIILRGCDTAAGVANMAQSLMDAADVKPLRKDAVRALEIIFSLPPESSTDHERFFNEAVQWAQLYFEAHRFDMGQSRSAPSVKFKSAPARQEPKASVSA